MADYLNALLNALNWLLAYLYKIVGYFLDGLVYSLKGVVYLIVAGFLNQIEIFVNAIDFTTVVFQWAAAYSNIPPQAQYILVSVGFPEFVGIVGAAYLLRLLLNFIPSWATRA